MAVQLEDNRHNSGMAPSFGGIVNRAMTVASANAKRRSNTGMVSRNYSVSVFYSLATEQDNEIEDELAQGTKKNRCVKI